MVLYCCNAELDGVLLVARLDDSGTVLAPAEIDRIFVDCVLVLVADCTELRRFVTSLETLASVIVAVTGTEVTLDMLYSYNLA